MWNNKLEKLRQSIRLMSSNELHKQELLLSQTSLSTSSIVKLATAIQSRKVTLDANLTSAVTHHEPSMSEAFDEVNM